MCFRSPDRPYQNRADPTFFYAIFEEIYIFLGLFWSILGLQNSKKKLPIFYTFFCLILGYLRGVEKSDLPTLAILPMLPETNLFFYLA